LQTKKKNRKSDDNDDAVHKLCNQNLQSANCESTNPDDML